MKASELVIELQKAIDKYGDLNLLRDCADGFDYEGFTVHGDPATDTERESGIEGTIDLNVW